MSDDVPQLTPAQVQELHSSAKQVKAAVNEAIVGEIMKLSMRELAFNVAVAALASAFKIAMSVAVVSGKSVEDARTMLLTLMSAASTPGGTVDTAGEELSRTLGVDAASEILVVQEDGTVRRPVERKAN